MPLFQDIEVDDNEVKKFVQEHWDIAIDECIKASQNKTYRAGNSKYVVRVTPKASERGRFVKVCFSLGCSYALSD
jgi:hypothetical protein